MTLFLKAASDTGTSSSDGLTNDTTPTLSGTATEAGNVEIVADGTVVATVETIVRDGANYFEYTSATLSPGTTRFKAQAVDEAGNAGPASDAVPVTVDTARPTATITVTDGTVLKAGDSTTVTIEFSEAVEDFTLADLAAENGTLTDLTSTSNPLVYTATLKPNANVSDASNVVTLTNTGVRDRAGNAGVGTTASNSYAVSTATAPTVTITVADTNLTVGETTTATIRFSEAVTGFGLEDLTAENGRLTALQATGDTLVYTATLTPTANVVDAENVVTLDNTGVSFGGNPGTGTTRSNSYAVSTDVPPTAEITVADTTLTAGETSLVTIRFSEEVTGLEVADFTVGNGSLSSPTQSQTDRTIYTATLTPTADRVAPTNVITLNTAGVRDLTDNAGTTTATSANYSIDTAVAPTATIALSATTLKAGETATVTVTFSETVTGLTETDFAVENGALTDLTQSGSDPRVWTATLRPAADVADASNLLRLDTARVQDLNGNAGTTTAESANYSIDTAHPTATIRLSDTALKRGETAEVTVTFSEAVTGLTETDFTVQNGSLGPLTSADGRIYTATLTPADGTPAAQSTITLNTAGVMDAAGNAGNTSSSATYGVDTLAPQAPAAAPTLAAASDSGVAGDRLTNVAKPTLTGTAEADSTVEILNGSTVVGTAKADDAGAYSITLTTALAEGTNSLTAQATDAAGNVGPASAALSVTLDTAVPTVSVPVLAAASDSGVAGDDRTRVARPTLTGTTEADSTVEILSGSAVVGSGMADAQGAYSITLTTTLTEGTNSLTARATDAAGNAATSVTALDVILDTIAPTAPSLALDAASNSGSKDDTVTNDATPTLTGIAELGSTVRIYDGQDLLGIVTADPTTGAYSFTPDTALADEAHVFTAQATDAAGNVGAASAARTVTVDTAPPTGLATLTLDAASNGGSKADTRTNDDTPTLKGTATAESSVQIRAGEVVVATVTAGADGTFSYISPTLADGSTTNFTAREVDAAGNVGTPSAVLAVTVDTTSPVEPAPPSLDVASDSGTAGDRRTNVARPTLAGTAEAKSTVEILSGSTVLGSGTANDAGAYSITLSTALTEGGNTLTARATDAAGNAATSATGLDVILDTTAPTATIELSDDALKLGDTSTVTVTFSEAVSDFTLADLTAESGTLSGLTQTGNPLVYIATLTPAAGTTAAQSTITLSTAGVTDEAGNAGTIGPSATYSVDTVRPTATIKLSDDALKLGDTSTVTVTFSEIVTGLTEGDFTVENGSLSGLTSADGQIYTATLTPAASTTAASSTIALNTAGVTDGAGNVGDTSASASYGVDTVRPTAKIELSDDALKVGDTSTVTVTFSEAVSDFTLADLAAESGTLSGLTQTGNPLVYTATLTPTAGVTDAENVVTLTNTGVSDAAGNAGGGTTTSGAYAVDTQRPTATITVEDTSLSAGETATVLIRFSEPVTGFTLADIDVENGSLSDLRRDANDPTLYRATLTPAADRADDTNTLFLDDAGVSDLAGNTGTGTTGSNTYAVDTRPTAPTPEPTPVQQTGTDGPDTLAGSASSDTILGGAGDDTVMGLAGDDVLLGNRGADVLLGNQGRDSLFGGQDADSVFGGQDDDLAQGNLGDDLVQGNLGNDTLFGGQGADSVFGGQGNDLLFGDLGDDVLSGDLGDDVLVGGAGADRYVFGQNSGRDVVQGFNQAEGDRLALGGQTFTFGTAADGSDAAVLLLSGGGSVQLAGITRAQVNDGFFA